MAAIRILITGSRDWDDLRHPTIFDALWDAYVDCPEGEQFVVVHGDCPTGADRIANDWVSWAGRWAVGIEAEPHPADWDTHGKSAGPIRNTEMVQAGADICLAFIKNESRGASDCARKAEAAGIPTRRYTA